MAKKRLLFIGDGVAPTGFSTVLTNIIDNLDFRKIEAHHLAINYRGDPHPYKWYIYPAGLKGDLMGYNRISDFANGKLDGIFILQDAWVIQRYLEIIKEKFGENIPPIVVYFPVDAIDFTPSWFKDYDIVNQVVVYTEFGKQEVLRSMKPLEEKLTIVPHGVNTEIFKKIDMPKNEIRKKMFPDKKEIQDGFVILNANRNTPRKRVDLTIQGFSMFAQDKPNVFLHLHMGIIDSGFNILELMARYNVSDKLLLTNMSRVLQSIPVQQLNQIYNSADVGINTCWGEGWGLPNMEHAVTGAPQVVPDHSSLHELYNDCGILIPVNRYLTNPQILTIGGYVHPFDVAQALEKVYVNRELVKELSEKSIEKFTNEKYSWKYIVKENWMPIFEKNFGV